ncbi:MAG TPA: hydroxyethylthiazole kinase [Nevskiaceae bacterium]
MTAALQPINAPRLATTFEAFRRRSPLVQCLTNTVVANFTANVLCALGASPAMVDNPREAGGFARIADGVLVNLGTPQADTAEAMALVIAGARAAGKPWVLDPVAVGPLAWRTSLAQGFVVRGPAIVRGNASEIMALAGGSGGRGVEATAPAERALDAAVSLARAQATAVAVSGAVDHLTDGRRVVRLSNGHAWLTRVIGTGCALGAMMAGFAAVTDDDALLAAACATAVLTVAADRAVARSGGPGSFAVALIDELAAMTPEALAAGVRIASEELPP